MALLCHLDWCTNPELQLSPISLILGLILGIVGCMFLQNLFNIIIIFKFIQAQLKITYVFIYINEAILVKILLGLFMNCASVFPFTRHWYWRWRGWCHIPSVKLIEVLITFEFVIIPWSSKTTQARCILLNLEIRHGEWVKSFWKSKLVIIVEFNVSIVILLLFAIFDEFYWGHRTPCILN